jgi:exodeoxyribonuclease VII small subunit
MSLNTNSPLNFEASLKELELLVSKMEAEQLTLEEALACFEKGVALTAYCQQALKAAELKIETIMNQGLTLS